MSGSIAERLAEVQDRVARAAEVSGRDPSAVRLIAVGKTFPAEVTAEAVTAGATDLGENRVQEAAAKRHLVPPATWHLIGPLQRNKARLALEHFDVIHTIDRPDIARRLQFVMDRDWPDERKQVLVEVNIGREPQKAGALPDEAEELIREVLECDRLELIGLMAIPPYSSEPEDSRQHFKALGDLRDELVTRMGIGLPHLSMGMSHDFEIAIHEGATMVRVGTAIFGPRG